MSKTTGQGGGVPPKRVDGKFVIDSLETIEQIIKAEFPDGLDVHLKKDFFTNGAMIGFNLKRYGYTNLFAAECHAMRDDLLGTVGYSYGFEFKPHVETHKAKDGEPEWYEVYTG
jgi:hypothetical protein